MSHVAFRKVLSHCPESKSERFLLAIIADRADDQGRGAWLDIPALAADADLTIKRCQDLIDGMIQRGRLLLRSGVYDKGKFRDLLDIVFPAQPADRRALHEARLARKRAEGKTRLGLPRTRKIEPSANRENSSCAKRLELSPDLEKFSSLRILNSSLKKETSSQNREKISKKNWVLSRLEREIFLRYVLIRPLKDIAIDIVSNAGAGAQEFHEASSPPPTDCVSNFFLRENEKIQSEMASTPDQAQSDLWDEHDELLLGALGDSATAGPTPSGAAPDGAEGGSEVDEQPLWDNVQGEAKNEDAPEFEKSSGAARRAEAAVGSEVYERLKALCGGSAKAPLLLERLKEYTPDDQSRRKWLTLSMAEIELAVAQGRVEVKEGRAASWRGGFIFALDAVVDGRLKLGGSPQIRPPASLQMRLPYDQQVRPSDGSSDVRKCNFAEKMRVHLAGRLGVVVSVTADAVQASVTVDFDDGGREVLTGVTLAPLREVLDRAAPPPPPTLELNTAYPVGSRWRHKVSGALLTVIRVQAASPTTKDAEGNELDWPAFGAGALKNQAERLEAQAGAA